MHAIKLIAGGFGAVALICGAAALFIYGISLWFSFSEWVDAWLTPQSHWAGAVVYMAPVGLPVLAIIFGAGMAAMDE